MSILYIYIIFFFYLFSKWRRGIWRSIYFWWWRSYRRRSTFIQHCSK